MYNNVLEKFKLSKEDLMQMEGSEKKKERLNVEETLKRLDAKIAQMESKEDSPSELGQTNKSSNDENFSLKHLNLFRVPENQDEENISISISNLEGMVSIYLVSHEDKYVFRYAEGKDMLKSKEFSKEEGVDFIIGLNNIMKLWKSEYSGNNQFAWNVSVNTKVFNKSAFGMGSCPENWNDFIDLLIKYVNIFNNK